MEMECRLNNEKRLAVFASGNGSNFQSIAEAIKSGKLEAEICLVVCDREDAYVLERAKLENIDLSPFQQRITPTRLSLNRKSWKNFASMR